MELGELANIGEFVGGVAVIGSLIYVGVQIRQNTRAVRSSTHHQMLAYTADIGMLVAGNSEVAEILERARDDAEALDSVEWARFEEVAFIRFGTWEAAYVGLRDGTIHKDMWEAWDGACRHVLRGDGYKKFWRQASSGYESGFRTYVDRFLV